LSNNNPTFLEKWSNGGIFKEMGNLSSTFKKAASAYSISDRQFKDNNKQLTLLSQCKLAFTGRNVLMALKIRRDIKIFFNKTGATLILA
jgi:hypothetical protein